MEIGKFGWNVEGGERVWLLGRILVFEALVQKIVISDAGVDSVW